MTATACAAAISSGKFPMLFFTSLNSSVQYVAVCLRLWGDQSGRRSSNGGGFSKAYRLLNQRGLDLIPTVGCSDKSFSDSPDDIDNEKNQVVAFSPQSVDKSLPGGHSGSVFVCACSIGADTTSIYRANANSITASYTCSLLPWLHASRQVQTTVCATVVD